MFRDTPERRRYVRVGSNVPLQYKKLRELSEGTIGAITQDLSKGGVRFLSNEFLPLASRLVVDLFLPAQPRPIKAISKVAWIKKASSGEQYIIGNIFLDLGRDDKGELEVYIDKIMSAIP